MKKETKMNLIFTAGLLAAALVLWALFVAGRPSGAVAVLTYGSDGQTMEIPLDKDDTYDVDTGLYTVHLQVRDGAIAFVNSPCPDHLCEGYGWLSKADDWAACLPAKANITVMSGGE